MDREQALRIVRQKIAGPRFEHTIRVLDTACELASRFGADLKKTEVAALFHDYAKLHSMEDLKRKLNNEGEDARLLTYHPELWHAPVAAQIVRTEFSIIDQDILNAIRYHTTGRPDMSLLEKVIYVADYMEPGRSFPGVDTVRALAQHDLNAAMLAALTNTIQFLVGKNVLVFPDTFEAYNYLIFNKEE